MTEESSPQTPENGPENGPRGGVAIAIGFYIALVMLVFGTILVLYGLVGSPNNARSLGININLWWGLVTVACGCVALGLSFASPRRRAERNRSR